MLAGGLLGELPAGLLLVGELLGGGLHRGGLPGRSLYGGLVGASSSTRPPDPPSPEPPEPNSCMPHPNNNNLHFVGTRTPLAPTQPRYRPSLTPDLSVLVSKMVVVVVVVVDYYYYYYYRTTKILDTTACGRRARRLIS